MRAIVALAALLIATGAAPAAEINAFISTAMKSATDELLPTFERANGHSIRASYAPVRRASSPLQPRRTRRCVPDRRAGARRTHQTGQDRRRPHRSARTGIGIAVRKGAPKPDVSTPEALKRALLAAKTRGPRLTGRRQHHRRPHHADVRKARHRRSDRSPRPSSPWAARTAASACWCRAAKPRSACNRLRTIGQSRCRDDRHAAAGIAADHDLLCRHHRQREAAGGCKGDDRAR